MDRTKIMIKAKKAEKYALYIKSKYILIILILNLNLKS